MKINSLKYVFGDLKPGEVFMYGETCCMKIHKLEGYNAMKVENGSAIYIEDDMPIDFKDQAILYLNGVLK